MHIDLLLLVSSMKEKVAINMTSVSILIAAVSKARLTVSLARNQIACYSFAIGSFNAIFFY